MDPLPNFQTNEKGIGTTIPPFPPFLVSLFVGVVQLLPLVVVAGYPME